MTSRELELPLHRALGMLAARQELPPLRQRLVGNRHRLAEHLFGWLEDRDRVAARLRHLLLAVEADEQRIGDDDLRLLPVALHDVARARASTPSGSRNARRPPGAPTTAPTPGRESTSSCRTSLRVARGSRSCCRATSTSSPRRRGRRAADR